MVSKKPILTFSHVEAIIDNEFTGNTINIILASNRRRPLTEVFLVQLEQADDFQNDKTYSEISAEHFINCVQKNYHQLKTHGVDRLTSLNRFSDEGDLVLYAHLDDTGPKFYFHHCGDGYLDYFNGWYCLVSHQ